MPHKVNFAAKYNTLVVMIITDNKVSGVFQGTDSLFRLQVGHISKIKSRTKLNAMRPNGCKRCLC